MKIVLQTGRIFLTCSQSSTLPCLSLWKGRGVFGQKLQINSSNVFAEQRANKSNSNGDYSRFHSRATAAGSFYPFKLEIDDMERDLFRQLSMGTTIGQWSGMVKLNDLAFPIPRKTQTDYDHFGAVVEAVKSHNPNFVYKLQASYYLRLITKMMDRIYGKHIDEMEKVVDDAFNSMHDKPKNKRELLGFIEHSLSKTVLPSKENKELFALCQETLPRVNFYDQLDISVLAKSIWVYLQNYVPEKKLAGIKVDDQKLNIIGPEHSVYFIHVASVLRNVYGNDRYRDVYQYSVQVRDLNGYAHCLMNMLHFQVRPDIRRNLVKILRQTRKTFLGKDSCQYKNQDLRLFVRHMQTFTLPHFEQLDGATSATSCNYSEAISDIYKMFFVKSAINPWTPPPQQTKI